MNFALGTVQLRSLFCWDMTLGHWDVGARRFETAYGLEIV